MNPENPTDEELVRAEEEVTALIGETPSSSDSNLNPNPQRMERIVDRAGYETVVKDTASFLFNSFTSALLGMVTAVLGGRKVGQLPAPNEEDQDKDS